MNTKRSYRFPALLAGAGLLASGALLTGCKGVPMANERAARRDVASVAGVYRPHGLLPTLPTLTTNSGLADFLQFAMLNQPRVEATYYDWLTSVERITVERSLPDPRLTFEMDIKELVEVAMPGLMMEFPGPGKLKARAAVASAESQRRYFAFESSVLQTAFALKKAYYQAYFLDGKIRVNQETLQLLADIEQIARRQSEVGKVTLQDVLRAQIEQDRLRTEVANLEDSRLPIMAQFHAALGLKAGEPGPPLPARLETTPLGVASDQLLATAFQRNPRLKTMEAEVGMAEAAIGLARKSRMPDFSAGVEVDPLASPTMVRPSLGMTLPIWRDKIAAEIAGAQANKRAAEARLSAEQIMVAVDLAERSYMVRETARNLTLFEDILLPKARQSLEVARSSYFTGRTDFFNLIDAWRTLLGFELMRIEAQTQRELALAELSLLIAGTPPAGAPFLRQTLPVTQPLPSQK